MVTQKPDSRNPKKRPNQGPVLRVVEAGQRSKELEDLEARITELLRAAKSSSTRSAYISDWKHFSHWCKVNDLTALPATPETVCLYLVAHLEAFKVSTLTRRLVSISVIHRNGGHLDPPTRHSSVRQVMQGIRREYGSASAHKSPILLDDLRQMVNNLPDTLIGKRDRALLLVGFAGAFRRGELVALDVRDIVYTKAGMLVNVRRSKTDQEGKGAQAAIPFGQHEETCPVKALRAWLAAAQIKQGPIFRGVDRHGNLLQRLRGQAVWIVVHRAATLAGLETDEQHIFGAHSLRAGLATAAAIAGVSERKIMDQTRHKSEKILRRYIRDADVWRENAATGTGL